MALNLTRIKTQHERAVLRAFRESIESITDQVVIKELEAAIARSDVDAVIELLGLDKDAFESLFEEIRSAYRAGGITGATQIGTIPTDAGTLVARFNLRNYRAEQWLSDKSSTLVTEVVDDQVNSVREQLVNSMAKGENPRKTALDIVGRIDRGTGKRSGGYIGLTSQQAKWSSNAEQELINLDPDYLNRKLRDRRYDKSFIVAMRTGTPLTKAQIERMTTALRGRTLRYRGETIARTEAINALRAGQYESIIQAIEKGKLELNEVKKTWDATMDGRQRHSHAMAEQQYKEGIPINEPFTIGRINGGFDVMMYPGDQAGSAENVIQCRCRLIAEIDFGKKLARVEGFR